jgi:hypothetical protein
MTIGKEKRIPFVIDTGLMGGKVACFVQTAHFDRLVDEGSVIVDDETFQEMTAHGISEFRAGRIVRLRIGGREHSALKVAEGDPSRLGLEFLSRYVVTFDFPNNRVFLKPGKRFAAEQPYDMSGLVLSRIGNDTVAIRVYDGSPADAAGLTEGQRILELDDKSVGDFTIFGLHAMLTDEGRVVRLLVQADDKPRELELKLADWQKVRRRAAGSDKR